MTKCELVTRQVSKTLLVILSVLSLSVLASSGCGIFSGSGPSIILIPARSGAEQPYQLYESVKARVIVTLESGQTVVSKNRVEIPAGAWISEFDPKED